MRSPFTAIQDNLVRLLGSSVEGRAALVTRMLRRDASEATTYWLQLVVSVGIAILGLVVGSTAVVIGAMLVAPLMGPIVGLAMGLASGSPVLVLRSAARIVASVGVAVGGAAAITRLLPFHELNAEIAARTAPTVLDLGTAVFCALAGVYASVRPGSDTATTAAGTSISISLVPPLCASGYGVGTTAWSIAGGAALLFLTNMVAIVVVGSVMFVALGFNHVDVVAMEHDELERDGNHTSILRSLARRLANLFASGWGPALRFAMPLVLLAAVYLPLRRALDEVAWQVRARRAVGHAIERAPNRVIQSRVRVERRQVDVVLVMLGTTQAAEVLREHLDAEIRRASGVAPRLEILAVPDATAFAGLESTLRKPVSAPASIAAKPSSEDQLRQLHGALRARLEALWPSHKAGKPLRVDVDAPSRADGAASLRVVHLGDALAGDTLETLERGLSSEFGKVTIVATALPARELTREPGDLRFVAELARSLRIASETPNVSVCVVRPRAPEADKAPPRERERERERERADEALARAVEPLLESARPAVVSVTDGDAWRVRFAVGPCVPPEPAPPLPAPPALPSSDLDAGAP